MKSFLVLSSLVAMAMARPQVLQLNQSPLSSLQAYASASASASSSPQQVSFLRLLPNSDGRVLEPIELSLANQQQQQQQRARLASDNARNGLQELPPQLLSVSSSISNAAPLAADGQVLDTLEVSLAKAAHAAAHRDEQLRLASQSQQAAQDQQQQSRGLAQALATVSPTSASTSSSVQLLESPSELDVLEAQQQQQQQQRVVEGLRRNLLLARESGRPVRIQSNAAAGLPLLVTDADGKLLATPLLLL